MHFVSNEFYDNGCVSGAADNHYCYVGVDGTQVSGYFPTGEVMFFANKFWGRIETVDGTVTGAPLDTNSPLGTPGSLCCIGYFIKSHAAKTVVMANALLGGYTHITATIQQSAKNTLIARGNIIEEAKFSDNPYRLFNWSNERSPTQQANLVDIHQNTVVNRSAATEILVDVQSGPPTITIVDNVIVANPNTVAADVAGTRASTTYPNNTYVNAAEIVDANNLATGGAALQTPVAGSQNWVAFEYAEPMSYRARTDSNRGGVGPFRAPTWYQAITPGRWGTLGIGSPNSAQITSVAGEAQGKALWPETGSTDDLYNPNNPLVDGKHPVSGFGAADGWFAFCSGAITYDGVNIAGTMHPGLAYVTGLCGGHRSSESNAASAITRIDSDQVGYARISDPSLPPVRNNPSQPVHWDAATQSWQPGQINYAADGGPIAVHSYGTTYVLPGNLMYTASSFGGRDSCPGGFHAQMDLNVNNRGVGGSAWKTTANGLGAMPAGWDTYSIIVMAQDGSMCYHAQTGYMWFFSGDVANNGWVWRRPPATGSTIVAVATNNPGNSLAISNGLQCEPIPNQPFILAHRREEIVPSLLDVTNPNSPTWYTITQSGMSWPTHWWTPTHRKSVHRPLVLEPCRSVVQRLFHGARLIERVAVPRPYLHAEGAGGHARSEREPAQHCVAALIRDRCGESSRG